MYLFFFANVYFKSHSWVNLIKSNLYFICDWIFQGDEVAKYM